MLFKVKSADLISYDHLGQVCERGELQHYFKNKKSENSCELGNILSSPDKYKQAIADAKLTIFDSTGMAAQDIMIAKQMRHSIQQARV